jgi:hypothetical protein
MRLAPEAGHDRFRVSAYPDSTATGRPRSRSRSFSCRRRTRRGFGPSVSQFRPPRRPPVGYLGALARVEMAPEVLRHDAGPPSPDRPWLAFASYSSRRRDRRRVRVRIRRRDERGGRSEVQRSECSSADRCNKARRQGRAFDDDRRHAIEGERILCLVIDGLRVNRRNEIPKPASFTRTVAQCQLWVEPGITRTTCCWSPTPSGSGSREVALTSEAPSRHRRGMT